MPGIRLIAFLTLTLLAPSCSSRDCSCRCGQREICDSIEKLQTVDDAHEGMFNHLTIRINDIPPRGMLLEMSMKMDDLEVALKRDSRDVMNRVAVLEENTSNRFIETADKMIKLRSEFVRELEEATQESDRQRDVLAKRLDDLESLHTAKLRDLGNRIRNLEEEIATMKRSEEVKKWVADLKESTSNRFIETVDNRIKLRSEFVRTLEESRQEFDRQRDVLAKRLDDLESLHTAKLRDLGNKIRKLEEEITAKIEENHRGKSEITSITNTKDTRNSSTVSIHNPLHFILVLIYCIFFIHINSLNMFL